LTGGLKGIRFGESEMDPCVWVRFGSDGEIEAVLLVQVDDLLGWCASIDGLAADLKGMGFKVGKLVYLRESGDTWFFWVKAGIDGHGVEA